jgi:hypothetical protein
MIPESLRALLSNLIDYAGLFPPAALPLSEVTANYERYLHSAEGWMLNRLVLPFDRLGEVKIGADWRLTLLVEDEPGVLPIQVETLETKGGRRLSLPTYCETRLDQVENGYAKMRATNPSVDDLAEFLAGAAARRLPFKATAGLHHPIRSATAHGFLNLFVAATFAWRGMDPGCLAVVLGDRDPDAFEFRDDELRWRDLRSSTEEVKLVRREFAHCFGSCSFEEPVNDLQALGLLQCQ